MPRTAATTRTRVVDLVPVLPSMRQWLRADSITGLASGAAVATWMDESGYGNHATQSTGASQPLWRANAINGYPVLEFDGADDYLSADGIASLLTGADLPFTFVQVFRVLTLPSGLVYLAGYGSATNF